MQIGYIGLGKMGKNMVLHLLEKKHQVVAWNRSPEPRQEVAAAGAMVTETVAELVAKLVAPRTVWVMLPAKAVTNQMISDLIPLLSPGDTIIDGGNSHYKDSQANGARCQAAGIHFLDVGTSGGPAGARTGACLMVGGEQVDYDRHASLFAGIAAANAVQFFPGHGAGHFVKMVHNGIEYGMIQSLAEGFAVLKVAPFQLDVQKVAEIYSQQSVITSRLVNWLVSGYQHYGVDLADISTQVGHNGEGEWTIAAAKEMGIPVPAIETALKFRLDSAQNPSYAGKVVNVLRTEFGGHVVKK